MVNFKYIITDPEGIHARPAGELVKAAKEFNSKITIEKDGKSGDCKKIFSIMALGDTGHIHLTGLMIIVIILV